ncbi:MAG: hypothetical protein CSA38_05345 [Flavobacteriales bacterium]|nr:MAG: hypothetical protein CSA38_05345 [Flavobacteriales bacterium]
MKKNHRRFYPYILLLILTTAYATFFLAYNDGVTERFRFVIQTFAFFLLIASASRKLLNFFIVFSFFLSCFVLPTLTIYGNINYNYISSIYYTNMDESVSYIKLIPFWVYLSLLLLAVYSVFLLKTKSLKLTLPKMTKVLLLVFLISFPLKKALEPINLEPTDQGTKISDFFYFQPLEKVTLLSLYFDVKKEDEKLKKQSQKPATWEIIKSSPDKTSNKTIVLVIGESVRKDFLHSYGFPIQNTPFIDASYHIQFDNYYAVAPHTFASLLRTISLSNDLENFETNNNILSLAKKIGYKTYWISNQGRIGYHDSPVTIIANQADEMVFLKKGNHDSSNLQDAEMLPYFEQVMDKKEAQPRLIVLHMTGSHPSSCDRTDDEYDEFILSDDISCYNKSIKMLDSFLEKVHHQLVKNDEDFSLIYFSDHGLKLKNNMLSHGINKQAFQVPFLLWQSDLKETRQIKATRTGKDFLHFFSQILGIETKNAQRNYQFISEEKNDDKSLRVNDGDKKVIDYNSLKNNSLPNDLIQEAKKNSTKK